MGPGHPVLAERLGNIAVVYLSEGRYAQAEETLKHALAIQQKALGPSNPDVAATLNDLAEVDRTEAKYTEADALYQQALAIYE